MRWPYCIPLLLWVTQAFYCSLDLHEPQNGTIFFFPKQHTLKARQTQCDFKLIWTWDCQDDCAVATWELNGVEHAGGESCAAGYMTASISDSVSNHLLVEGENVFAIHLLHDSSPDAAINSAYSLFTVKFLEMPTHSLLPFDNTLIRTRIGKFKAQPADYFHSIMSWILPEVPSASRWLFEVPFSDDPVETVKAVDPALFSFSDASNYANAATNSTKDQPQRRMRAYVVNMPTSHDRWAAVLRTIETLPTLQPIRWPAVPLDDPRILAAGAKAAAAAGAKAGGTVAGDTAHLAVGAGGDPPSPAPRLPMCEARSLSLRLSFKDAWAHFVAAASAGSDGNGGGRSGGGDGGSFAGGDRAKEGRWCRGEGDDEEDEEEWALFLEDDAEWHPSLKGRPGAIQAAIDAGLAIAQEDGFAFLGACNPSFVDRVVGGRQVWISSAVVLARGSAHCAHGYAITRRLARTLANELEPSSAAEREAVPELSSHHIDVRLRYWSQQRGPSSRMGRVIIGSNLTADWDSSFMGVLLQNWRDFPSVRRADGSTC